MRLQQGLGLLLAFGVVLDAASSEAVSIDWVTVGDPGNVADDTGFGAVAEVYRISKFEITNAQYAEFLNSVATTDPNGLYNTRMADPGLFSSGGITRVGASGSYSYSTIAGREDNPINWVSLYDALRFVNWLHNGQPTGEQGPATTEDGTYTITPAGISANSITRNEAATIFLTSEDEWYKAAYYDALSTSYFDYPAGSNVPTTCAAPGPTPNTANCFPSVPQDVGGYTGSASPNETFDQGGNVWEWNEDVISGSNRVFRGGSFFSATSDLAATFRVGKSPFDEADGVGFRVASSVPEPGTALLVATGLLMLGCWRSWR